MGWGAIAQYGAEKGMDLGHGIITGKLEDKRQIKQTKKLMGMEERASKRMAGFNSELAYEMWLKTNYAAQREQMEKAGLNPGLMYGGTGAGGTTTGAGTGQGPKAGSATGGTPLAQSMGIEMNKRMQTAQIANIEANTEKTKVDTQKTAGVDTEKTGAEVQNLKQLTTNAELQNKINNYEKEIKGIEANISNQTQDQVINQINIATEKLKAETQSASAKGEIDQSTKENIIKAADLANQATTTNISATKTGMRATETNIKATEAGTARTQQETTNLQQDEIYKKLENGLKENGIEKGDPAIVRIASRTLKNMGTDLKTITYKMGRITQWIAGKNGPQTQERLEEIINE